MVNYYTTVTPHLRNQPIYIQYSNHRELKTDNLPNQAVSVPWCVKNLRGKMSKRLMLMLMLLGGGEVFTVIWNFGYWQENSDMTNDLVLSILLWRSILNCQILWTQVQSWITIHSITGTNLGFFNMRTFNLVEICHHVNTGQGHPFIPHISPCHYVSFPICNRTGNQGEARTFGWILHGIFAEWVKGNVFTHDMSKHKSC